MEVNHWSIANWNAYVEAGARREERKRRLEQVPDKWRADVKRHAQTVYAIRKFHDRKKRQRPVRGKSNK